jgi:hypothetical protein
MPLQAVLPERTHGEAVPIPNVPVCHDNDIRPGGESTAHNRVHGQDSFSPHNQNW